MERGEIGVLAAEFGALVIVLLVLSGFANGTSALSTPQIKTVYWGQPPPGVGNPIAGGHTSTETTNATTISFTYTLAESTTLRAVSASRYCTGNNGTGQELVYTNIPQMSNDTSNVPYFTFGPTNQPVGWSCLYTITITDSLEQTTTWTGTVIFESSTSVVTSSSTSS